ncbi:MAG: EamA family transporter [Acidobacteriaceae bacterium]
MNLSGDASVWSMIGVIVVLATTGDVLLAGAIRKIGDFDVIRGRSGLGGAILAVVLNVRFCLGVLCMALSFFALLFALSWAEVSLVAPASAALTFVTNAFAAKWLLKENVDGRRWMAAVCVCAGVFFLSR